MDIPARRSERFYSMPRRRENEQSLHVFLYHTPRGRSLRVAARAFHEAVHRASGAYDDGKIDYADLQHAIRAEQRHLGLIRVAHRIWLAEEV